MEFKEFTVEGEAQLGYMADAPYGRDRVVMIQTDGSEAPIRLETLVAQALGFPSDEEFDAMHQRLQQLREQSLQPADGEPDIARTGIRLRVEIELLDG